MKPINKASFQRVFNATRYSLKGLKSAYLHEAAFRQEIGCAIVLFLFALFLGQTNVEKILLIGSIFIVLITELLNSAIESVVDRIGEEHHELSGRAKDIGSAAVFMSIILLIITWILVIFF